MIRYTRLYLQKHITGKADIPQEKLVFYDNETLSQIKFDKKLKK